MTNVQKWSLSRCWPWVSIAILVALADQIIKGAVQALMSFGQVIPLTAFFNWVYAGNTGAAFSFFADAGGWQRYFFVGVALVVAVVLIIQLCKPISRSEAIAYCLMLGGAIGNTIDRLVRGYVVDYLDIYWGKWHWPAFNLADIALFTGAVTLVVVLQRKTNSKLS